MILWDEDMLTGWFTHDGMSLVVNGLVMPQRCKNLALKGGPVNVLVEIGGVWFWRALVKR